MSKINVIKHTPKILFVDDEVLMENAIKDYFEDEIEEGQYEFHFAQNGEQAYKYLLAHPDIDILITDIKMPKMDGLELLKNIYNRHIYPKILVISAYGEAADFKTMMRYNTYDFLAKPFDMITLQTNMDELVEVTPRVPALAREIKGISYPTIVKLSQQLNPFQQAEIVKQIFSFLNSALLKDVKEVLENIYSLSEKEDEEDVYENKRFLNYLISQIEKGIIKSPVPIEDLRKVTTFTLEERYVHSNGNKYGPYHVIRFRIKGKLLSITLKSDPRIEFPEVFLSQKSA